MKGFYLHKKTGHSKGGGEGRKEEKRKGGKQDSSIDSIYTVLGSSLDLCCFVRCIFGDLQIWEVGLFSMGRIFASPAFQFLRFSFSLQN